VAVSSTFLRTVKVRKKPELTGRGRRENVMKIFEGKI